MSETNDLGVRADGGVAIPIEGSAGRVTVHPELFSAVVKVDGRPVPKEKGGWYDLSGVAGYRLAIRLKRRFIDPFPDVYVNDERVALMPRLGCAGSLMLAAPLLSVLLLGPAMIIPSLLVVFLMARLMRSRMRAVTRGGLAGLLAFFFVFGASFIHVAGQMNSYVAEVDMRVVQTRDGLAEIRVPSDWVDTSETERRATRLSAPGDEAVLFVIGRRTEGSVNLGMHLVEARPAGATPVSQPVDTLVNGFPARREEVRMAGPEQLSALVQVVDTGSYTFLQTLAFGPADLHRWRVTGERILDSFTTTTARHIADASSEPGAPFPLTTLRRAQQTSIQLPRPDARGMPPEPQPGVFERVKFRAPLGEHWAFVTPPRQGEPGPGVIWIVGGFTWGAWDTAWGAFERRNDQSARQYREAGLAMMWPSTRGVHDNPGEFECYGGEIDDILAAIEYFAARPDVDPNQIYLAGHSGGATLAMLVAASTERLAGVIAFGPIGDVAWYRDADCVPPNAPVTAGELRAPVQFARSIRVPTYVVEGSYGNAESAHALYRHRGRAPLRSIVVNGATHFDILAPGNEAVAAWIQAGGPRGGELTAEAIISRFQAAAPPTTP